MSDGWEDVPVCVVGAGYMGSGIAQVLALAGARTTVVDADPERAGAGLNRLREQAEAFEADGLFPAGAAATVRDRTSAGADLAAAGAAALVIEAVYEDVEIKRDVLAQVERHVQPGAVLATNTSTIPIRELAVALQDPSRFLGMHWFNPPQFVPGVEIIPGADTAAELPSWLRELLRLAGKWPAIVSDSPGFVANRLQFALFREAALMLQEGVAPADQIDEVVRGTFGYRLPFFGPFAIADMAGLDVYAASYGTMSRAYGDRFSAPQSLTDLVDGGQLGTKSGGGYLELTAEETAAMIARRDRSYAALLALIQHAVD